MSLLNNIPSNANKLDPKSITVSRIVFTVISLIILLAGSGTIFGSKHWLSIVIPVAIAISFFLFGLYWSKKSYTCSFWWFAEEGLYIQRGVYWRKRILVPKNRVQHTDVAQGPLARKYEIAKLVVHTAGTRDSSVTLDGISLETANELRDLLIDLRIEKTQSNEETNSSVVESADATITEPESILSKSDAV